MPKINYKKALREMMLMAGYNYEGLARAMGYNSALSIKDWIKPYSFRYNNPKRPAHPRFDNLIRIVEVMNGEILFRWHDPKNLKRSKTWRVDLSDFFKGEVEKYMIADGTDGITDEDGNFLF